MDVNRDAAAGEQLVEEQLVYAAWLDAGTKIGLVLLVVMFGLYVSGALPAHVAFADLPRLWSLPVDRYLAAAGLPAGWGWLALVGKGDVVNFLAIAFLAFVTIACYLRLALTLLGRGDLLFGLIAVAEIGVLALAASGLINAGH